jgi:hypothetical protein
MRTRGSSSSLGIPYVGEFLAAIIAMLPSILAVLAAGFVHDIDSGKVIDWTMLVSLPITYFWLRYLERKAGLVLCLPLPIMNIRIKWILLPVGLFVAYLLLTGQTS